jgi:4-hydroxymandelate oxidase
MFDGQFLTIADYEQHVRQQMSPALFDCEYGSHGDPAWSTYTSNRAGFHALKLRPRVLVDVSRRSLATEVLGQSISLPVVVGPTGGLGVHDPQGELPTVRAAGAAGTIMVLSGLSTCPAADVAGAATCPWLQQVWILEDRELVAWQVRNAEELGAAAIVLTVSNTGETWHSAQLRFPTTGAPDDGPASNLVELAHRAPTVRQFMGSISRASTWADVRWLRELTSLPLVIKGIQTSEDAELCVEHGVDGIVVSNHGGRFLQGARGTIEALPEITATVGERLEVYLDGGVRQGQDVLKALALGARAVWLGRAARWGTTVAGEQGVRNVLEILQRELDGSMGLCGITDVRHVPASLVTRDVVPTVEN